VWSAPALRIQQEHTMAEMTRTRTREPEPGKESNYEFCMRTTNENLERGLNGKIVMRESELDWETNRQGFLKYYLMGSKNPEAALHSWMVFVHDVRKGSGKHIHQGGLVLFILEGRGATECNGEIIEWEKGDCVLLPFHPDGVEHAHYNRGTEPAKWLAMIYFPIWDFVASEMTQTRVNENFRAGA
jgi:quercetin dioxygenase-like cupin family protein